MRASITKVCGRVVERALGEDHEEVGLEARPLHLAQARDARREGHALHVPHDLVAQADAQLARERRVERRSGRPRRGAAFHSPGRHHAPGHDALRSGLSGRGSCCGTRGAAPSARAALRLFVLDREQLRGGVAPLTDWIRIGTIGTTGAVSGPRARDARRARRRAGRAGCRRRPGWAASVPPVDAQLAQQVVLHEHERAEQERAEAQGEHDHDASGSRAGRGWRGPGARGRGAGAGRSGARPRTRASAASHSASERDADRRPRRPAPVRETARLEHGQRQQARREQARRRPGARARSRRRGPSLEVAGAGRRAARRGAPPSSGSEREDQGHPDARRTTPASDGGPGQRPGDVHRQQVAQQAGQGELHAAPSAAPTRLPSEPHRRAPGRGRPRGPCGARAEAAQHGDRLHACA